MIIAAVIRLENQILLQRVCENDNKIVWELPNCEVVNISNSIDSLVKKCTTLNVTIEVTDVIIDEELDNQRCIVYNTELLSYMNSNNSACWVDVEELRSLTFTKQYVGAIDKIIEESNYIDSINNEIENTVIDVSKNLGIKIEQRKLYKSFSVFVQSDYGNYCPFIFSIDYTFEPNDNIKFNQSWHITRMFADGDKSDLYVLFANLMAVFLKCFFQKNVYINYLSFFDQIETNAASIIFTETHNNLSIMKLKEAVEQNYVMYSLCLMLFENYIGSFSLVRDDSKFNSKYEAYFGKSENNNSFSRKEHQYYFNFDKGISLLNINNGIYDMQNLLKAHTWELLDGVDGKILHQIDMEKESFNYVSYEDWKRVSEIIEDMKIQDYQIVCQTNHLYLLENNSIWILNGDFSEYWVTIEKEKILNRQSLENRILRFNRLFKWRYPVNPGRFEALIADLVETDIMVQSVRLVGKSNNADGGRDLLIFKKYMQEEGIYNTALLVGQCKAYEKSVNKSHVRDIRDIIDYYNAVGYFLAVTSGVTTQLIDHLCKLKEKRDVDWWTEREIFKKLRQNSYIADRYMDIIEVVN